MKERKIILWSLAIGLALAVGITVASYVYAQDAQGDIAEGVVRFHVLANSDSEEDQALKLLVRDKILDEFEPGIGASGSAQETKEYLAARLNGITACAEAVIKGQGFDYPVTAKIEKVFFPTKAYGDVIFPPGEYEALRIFIGEGAGQNWWCVMFPPLCYVDLTRPIPETEMTLLNETVSDEGYKLLTHQEQDDSVKVKFKIVEWWQSLTGGAPKTDGAVVIND